MGDFSVIDLKDLMAEPVTSDADVQMLRAIRNVCREGFAHDTEPITAEQQCQWWAAGTAKGDLQAWLYVKAPHRVIVGYGLLRRTEDGRWWTSVGVFPQHAGQGYGGAITCDLVERAPEPPYAQARKDNPAAVRLHRDSHWERVGEDERLVHFRARSVWPPHEAREQWAREGWALA
jgi:GNAT superfamily N-acetyltransferase